MTISKFIDKLQYDKNYALNRCLNDECWMRMVANLRDVPGHMERFFMNTSDEEITEFYRFIDGNGFTMEWHKINDSIYEIIMEL